MYFVWIREAPKPSWDVSLFMSVGQDQAWWGGPRVRHGPSMGLPQQRSTSSSNCSCGHSLIYLHLKNFSTDKEPGLLNKVSVNFSGTFNMIGLCGP